MSSKQLKDEKARLRELACRTLEAYRNLNTVAAEASLLGNDKPDGEGLTRASELLEVVIAEIKGTAARATTTS
ncbi:MAG: hypothetical protein V3U13_03210 [Gemmatimonadota bacterium]